MANQKIENILRLLEKDLTVLNAPLSRGAEKMVEAAQYGEIRYVSLPRLKIQYMTLHIQEKCSKMREQISVLPKTGYH